MLKVKNLEVFFDNGGGTTVQCDGYAFRHDNPINAAEEIKDFLDGGEIDYSESSESREEDSLEYDSEIEQNGGYKHMTIREIQKVLEDGSTIGCGYNHSNFFETLGVEIED